MALAKSRQKEESDLDRQYKQSKIDYMNRKIEALGKSDPYILKNMTILNSLYNRISTDTDKGLDTKRLRSEADALETHLSPYMGIGKEEMSQHIKGYFGTSFGEKDTTATQYTPFEQTAKSATQKLKPMTDVEKSKVTAARKKGISEEQIKEAVAKDGFAWEP